MSPNHEDEKAFARTLFAPDGDGDRTLRNLFASDDQVLDDKQNQRADGTDDGLDAQRRFAVDLFAGDDEDAGILAGLGAGRTTFRTSPPRRGETPKNEFRFS